MPVEGYMWLGSILNNTTQKYEDRRGCTEVGLGAATLRQQQSREEDDEDKSAAGLKGLRLLRREEIEVSEDDVCQLTSFDICPVVWMKLQDLSGP